MSVLKFVFRSLGTHVIAAIAMLFLSPALMVILPDQAWYQYLVSAVLFGFYWYFMLHTTEKTALTDIKQGKYTLLKPILFATALNLVNIALIVLDATVGASLQTDYYKALFRYWNPAGINFLILLEDRLWVCIVIMLSYFPMSIIAYGSGKLIVKREKLKIKETAVSHEDED